MAKWIDYPVDERRALVDNDYQLTIKTASPARTFLCCAATPKGFGGRSFKPLSLRPVPKTKRAAISCCSLRCGRGSNPRYAWVIAGLLIPPAAAQPPPRGLEVARSSLFRFGQCQKQKEQQFLAALCGADEARTRDLRRDRPAF